MNFKALFKFFQVALLILFFSSCAQFELIDRAYVNKPAMNLESPLISSNQGTLANQKSSSSLTIGSCSVCAH